MSAQQSNSHSGTKPAHLSTAPPNPEPDARYKADILVIVAHPDDETMVDAYLARAVDEGKKVSVLYMTRGRAGQNWVGNEQGLALADERVMEARHSLASLGITNVWFLNGPDTPGSDILRSLEAWGEGAKLGQTVRIVRLTRPEVILTLMPDYIVGENHTNHQAAGVIATEAFDLAANPLAFPVQVEAPHNHLDFSQYGEGMRPWQPKKIYYFDNSLYTNFYKGNGPQYSSTETSPSKGKTYAQLAYQAARYYKTQFPAAVMKNPRPFEQPVRFIFGKSLVGGTATSDIFEGVTTTPLAYVQARGYKPVVRPALSLELSGPWTFFQRFWPAHNIDHLAKLYPPEAQCSSGQSDLWIPLIIYNNSDSAKRVTLRSVLAVGWSDEPGPMIYEVEAHGSYPISEYVSCPQTQTTTWQRLTWTAKTGAARSASVTLHVNWTKPDRQALPGFFADQPATANQ